MINEINCIDLQREIRDRIVEEANYDIRILVDNIKKATEKDSILIKYKKYIDELNIKSKAA